MSDDRGWYPVYGSDDRGGEGQYRDEPEYDPYAQGQPSGRPPQGRPPSQPYQQGGQRGQQPPRDAYQPPRPPQRPQQPQPQPQQPRNGGGRGGADAYGRQGGGPYGRDAYGAEGYGNQGGGYDNGNYDERGRGRGGERAMPVDAYPGPDRFAETAWAPTAAQPGGSGQGGRRGVPGGAEGDAWSPRSRGGRTAAGSVAFAEGHVNDDVDLDEIDPHGHARKAAQTAVTGRKPQSRKRKAIKWTAIGVSSALVLILSVGAYVILHLTGNIKHTALLQNGVSQSPEPTDKYGRSPLNILVIGSDTRSTAADCKAGGDCGAGANADVEMVVHLAADRSNATVMSIPRDTIVTLPHCTDPTTHASGGGFSSTINTSLQWGPACTVEAVKDLTGLIIDHFVMVDFSGVETLSEALGGVQVCVSAKMYDPYSHLRLNKGTNMVQGVSALAFVRSRHGFYDGSDLGREKAQHYFLSAMIREVRANMNLSDFGTLFKVADAATKALTVDDGLSGVTGLEGLATTMNRVPTDRISFVTMPWNIDPANKAHVVVAQPYASQMFDNIKNDVPYTANAGKTKTTAPATTGAPSTTPTTQPPNALATPTVAVDKAQVHVQVLNGSGVSGRASAVKDGLVADGFNLASVGGNAASTSTTKVYYPSNRADSAATVANALGMPASALVESTAYAEVTVVIGKDWTTGTTLNGTSAGGANAGAAPTTAASAPAVSSLSNAATTGSCVTVNPTYIVK